MNETSRRIRTVKDKLDATGKEISVVMTWYLDGEIWVNRKYQRKLVWSLCDKKDFIDSILDNILTPSMMLCAYEENGENKLEIIDGLQRLNAIMSFIFNEFPVMYEGEERYFDMSVHHRPFALLRAGKIEQKQPVLPEEVCIKFLSYQLLLSITQQDDDKVEKTFLRINSSGKKLSAQDLRQSSSCDTFADLIRRVSCYARGEFSFGDEVNLMDMPKISMSSPGLSYGVPASKTFWRRHDVITFENLRQSRDEELIAKIAGELLLDDVINPSSDMLDKMYKPGNDYNTKLNSLIESIGIENLEDNFRNVFNSINNVFKAVDSDFSSWVFEDRRVKNKNDCFRIFFIALYRLMSEGFSITDYKQFAESLHGFAGPVMHAVTTAQSITNDIWRDVSDAVQGIIQKNLTRSVPHERTDMEEEIDHRLLLSSVESAMTEFKAGISDFDTGEKKESTIHRIAKAMSAMANTDSKSAGMIILGIANDKDTKDAWESAYGRKALERDGHYVLGVSAEASGHYHDMDSYMRSIIEGIEKEPMDTELKEYAVQNIWEVDFYDKKLIVIPVKRLSHSALYDEKLYVRHGSHNYEIRPDSDEYSLIQQRFYS